MSIVTYHHQPGIHATRGAIPLAGTRHLYTVSKVLWPEAVNDWISERLLGVSLHVCCGASPLGTYRLDIDPTKKPSLVASADRLPFADNAVHTVLCDPPYNGIFQFNHDLLAELSRVASGRIIFQHWFLPANPDGLWKKAQEKFALSEVAAWQPRTYFGRAQIISVFDRRGVPFKEGRG